MRNIDLTGKRFTKLLVQKLGFVKNQTKFWECQCDCGKICFVRTGDLNRRQRSCGCAKAELIRQVQFHANKRRGCYSEEASYNRIISMYRETARKKDLEWGLTQTQAFDFLKKNCFYCGKAPSFRIHYNNNNVNYFYNGIDRVDNQKGYLPDNVVTCCKPCNMGKGCGTQLEYFERCTAVAKTFNRLKGKGMGGRGRDVTNSNVNS